MSCCGHSIEIPHGPIAEGDCKCWLSTAVCGCTSRGKGSIDFHGLWQFPCQHGHAFTPTGSTPCPLHGEMMIIEVPAPKPSFRHWLLNHRVVEVWLLAFLCFMLFFHLFPQYNPVPHIVGR